LFPLVVVDCAFGGAALVGGLAQLFDFVPLAPFVSPLDCATDV
jgi:hypothetical protein